MALKVKLAVNYGSTHLSAPGWNMLPVTCDSDGALWSASLSWSKRRKATSNHADNDAVTTGDGLDERREDRHCLYRDPSTFIDLPKQVCRQARTFRAAFIWQ